MTRIVKRLFCRMALLLLLIFALPALALAAHVENVPVTVQNFDGSFSTVLQPQVVPDFFDFAASGYAFDAGPRFIGNRVFVNGVPVFRNRAVFVRPVFHGRRW